MKKRTEISNRFKKIPDLPLRQVIEGSSHKSADRGGYTVGQYLGKWLVSIKRNIGQRTFETYREIVEKHLIPSLGSILLVDLDPLDIDEYYTYALEAGRLDGKGGLSARSVNHHHRLLHGALEQALRWGLINRNPADAVRAPKPVGKEMSVLSNEQLAQLLKAAKGSRAYMAILLAATTGARRGEVLALRWADLDLQSGKAVIRRSLQLTETGISFKEPKTRQSSRVVTLPMFTIGSLKEHRKRQAEDMLLLGAQYKDFGLVCAQKDGTPINPASLSKHFLAIVRKTGIPHVRFHDLRHTHASILLSQGINPKVVSERLGHSSVSVTLETYSHVLPGMQEEVAKKIDAALGPAILDLAA
ncbi:MAG: tyrosine-type recombinase/integrase [Thermoleophilia bacterium]